MFYLVSRESYKDFVKILPIEKFLNSRKDLCLWLYKIHNMVNEKLGVPASDIPHSMKYKNSMNNLELV